MLYLLCQPESFASYVSLNSYQVLSYITSRTMSIIFTILLYILAFVLSSNHQKLPGLLLPVCTFSCFQSCSLIISSQNIELVYLSQNIQPNGDMVAWPCYMFFSSLFLYVFRANQGSIEAGLPNSEACSRTVHPEVSAGHGTRLQLCYLSGRCTGRQFMCSLSCVVLLLIQWLTGKRNSVKCACNDTDWTSVFLLPQPNIATSKQ